MHNHTDLSNVSGFVAVKTEEPMWLEYCHNFNVINTHDIKNPITNCRIPDYNEVSIEYAIQLFRLSIP
jgi:hypothetical protein